MRFEIPAEILSKLRLIQEARATSAAYTDEIVEHEDAVAISYGLGPALYLTMDGRIIVHAYLDDEDPYVSEVWAEGYESISIATKSFGIPELRLLLPSRPAGAEDCTRYKNTGWMEFGTDVSTGQPGEIVCFDCHGLGWSQSSSGE